MDLKAVTLKTATLLKLIFCQCAQTIFTLDLRYIKNDKNIKRIICLSICFRPGSHSKSVILKCYLSDTKIYQVEVLHTYLKATTVIRKSETKSLISFLKPCYAVKVKVDKNFLKKKLYGPFSWMGFNCLKARATSRRQFTFYH